MSKIKKIIITVRPDTKIKGAIVTSLDIQTEKGAEKSIRGVEVLQLLNETMQMVLNEML